MSPRARLARCLLVLLLGAAAALGGAGPALAKPPIWIVRSRYATAILFGSIHLLPPGLDWRPPALDEALATADELWFELPINAQSDAEADDVSRVRGRLDPGQRLSAMLEPDEAEALRRAAEKLHRYPDALDQMQPWMADLTLSVAEDAAHGAEASSGVEDQIAAVAPPQIKRCAFETPIEQIDFLAGAPLKDQLASLAWTLHEIDDEPDAYDRVLGAWMAGDVDGVDAEAVEPLRRIAPDLFDRLITDRNGRWADALGRRLQRPGRLVVVVGVGHLVGAQGLPALLARAGFVVEGPISGDLTVGAH